MTTVAARGASVQVDETLLYTTTVYGYSTTPLLKARKKNLIVNSYICVLLAES